jgi:hypothetical protein
LASSELPNSLIDALQDITDFKFINTNLLKTSHYCFKVICQHIVQTNGLVKMGVFLFGWHLESFTHLQSLLKVNVKEHETILLKILISKGFSSDIAAIISHNPSKFLYPSVFTTISYSLPDAQVYLVDILSKLDISCDPE